MTTRDDLTDLPYRLIVRAAHKAPTALAARLEEEWLADLESRSGPLSRLRLAIGCWWATGIITQDFHVPQLAASGAASGPRQLSAGLQLGLPQLSRRTATFILIAAFHVLLIYGFASGFARQVVVSFPQALQASFTEESRPQHLLPALPLPNFKPTVIAAWKLPPPDPQQLRIAPEDGPGAPGGSAVPGGGDPLPVPAAAQRVMGGPGKGFPATDDYYPTAARRLVETGAAIVQVCVDTNGRLTADPILGRSSGSRRIDEGALNLAKAGSGHYRPTTQNGQNVNACFPYRIRFELN